MYAPAPEAGTSVEFPSKRHPITIGAPPSTNSPPPPSPVSE